MERARGVRAVRLINGRFVLWHIRLAQPSLCALRDFLYPMCCGYGLRVIELAQKNHQILDCCDFLASTVSNRHRENM